MSLPDLTQAESKLCVSLKTAQPNLKIDAMPSDLGTYMKTKMKQARGVALVQFITFSRKSLDESREGFLLLFEVTVLNKSLRHEKGHHGVNEYLTALINALHRDTTTVSGIEYTYLIDKGGFTGMVDAIWEYTFTVEMVPSLLL